MTDAEVEFERTKEDKGRLGTGSDIATPNTYQHRMPCNGDIIEAPISCTHPSVAFLKAWER